MRRENLENERKEKQRKERERALEVTRLQKRCNDLGGVWTSSEEVDEQIQKMTTGSRGDTKAKLEAIKTQISFRKKVYDQRFPAKLGNFSSGGKPHTLDDMVTRLKEIIALFTQ